MPNDINELDVTDAGLKGIFGDRFTDETQSEPKKVISKKETTTTTHAEKTAQKPKEKPVDASWCPAKPKPNEMDKLKGCVKWLAVFGGLSFLVFYWREAGLMADSIATPCIAICTALAGWGCGRIVGGKR